MRFRTGCIIALPLLAVCGLSLAADLTLTRTARSGVASLIGYERSWDRSCQALESEVTITAQPAHGTVSVVAGQSVIPATTPRGGSTGACAGHAITGNQVMYQSAPGFVGTDHVSWSVVYGPGRSGRTDVTIVVQ